MRLFLVSVFFVAAEAVSLVSGEQCKGEQSSWCGSLQTARSCRAISYCLKTVWEPWNVSVQQTRECYFSQKVVRTVRQLIAKEEGLFTEEGRYMMASGCKFIPDDKMRMQCKNLVTDFLPEIKRLLFSSMEPAAVATVMGLCQPLENSVETASGKGAHPQRKKAGDTLECELCETFMSSVDAYLLENKTELEVKQLLKDICKKLPAQITAQCLPFVDEYAVEVLQLLVEEELDPVKVCQGLKLCSNSSAVLFKPTKKVGLPAILCTICDVLVGLLEAQLSKNTTEADIEKALDKECRLLPASLASMCVTAVNMYVPAIIELLEQELPPNKVCEEIRLCNATASMALLKFVALEEQSADPVKCDLCKVITAEIKSLLGNRSVEQGLIHTVEKVCDVVQGDLRLQCKSEVENYGPAVLNLVRHMDDPAQVCTYLNFCASTPSAHSSPYNVQMMIGSEECTRGPAFWCATVENARKCGMEQECVKKYGLKP